MTDAYPIGMKRLRRRIPLRLVLLAGLAGCQESTGPSGLAPQYLLATVDGQAPPTGIGMPEGYLLLDRTLSFGPSFDGWDAAEEQGLVTIRTWIRGPGGTEEISEGDYDYFFRDSYLTINLCPVGAACFQIVPHDLGGPVVNGQLVLTEHVAGRVGPTYRYAPILID